MNKRAFLKASTAMIAGTFFSPLLSSQEKKPLTNWSGNLTYSTSNVFTPNSIQQVQEFVNRLAKLRALGSKHSFNAIADSNKSLVSTAGLNRILSLDRSANTVTVEAGIKYGELCQYLHENGYALHNLASLPHISIAGACSTATHGSGVMNGNLATQVSAIEFVKADGDIVTLSRNDGELFNGAVVGLGALGIVTKITLDLLPTFNMHQVVYRNLPMDALENNFEAIMSSGYSVSLFTDWKNKNINEVWIKSHVEGNTLNSSSPEFYGARLASKNMHPIEDQPAENCTDQMGVPGVWYERLPHFKMGFTPSAGKELQAEYFIPFEHGYKAMMAVEKLHEKISPHVFISEIRSIAADNLWMSPCYKKRCVAIHTTWKQEDVVRDLLPLVEQQLAPFNPIPHWGKLSALAPSLVQARFEKLKDFKQLMHQYDPKGKFRNEFLDKSLFS
ncbi:MAG TPA: FAD-binding protein [Cyclobacteriaceae bacterium]|jgi:xylitol oxidase|nr:FAD-binding protein [Cyclobacteriaceae bacterium]